MTMMSSPQLDAAAYRAPVPVPPDVRLADVGAACPDDTVLLDMLPGWYCQARLTWWDRRGRAGTWLDADERERVRRRLAVGVAVAAVPAVAGGYVLGRWRPWAPVAGDDLLTAVAVAATVVLVVVTAAVAVVRRHAIGEAVRRGC